MLETNLPFIRAILVLLDNLAWRMGYDDQFRQQYLLLRILFPIAPPTSATKSLKEYKSSSAITLYQTLTLSGLLPSKSQKLTGSKKWRNHIRFNSEFQTYHFHGLYFSRKPALNATFYYNTATTTFSMSPI